MKTVVLRNIFVETIIFIFYDLMNGKFKNNHIFICVFVTIYVLTFYLFIFFVASLNNKSIFLSFLPQALQQ